MQKLIAHVSNDKDTHETNTNTKKGEKTSRTKVFMGEEGWASEDAQSSNKLFKGLRRKA